jgi:hypothetical protein
MTPKVDHNALRTNQAFIIGLLIIAFVIGTPLLVVFVAAVMLIGTAFPSAGLFKRFYQHILLPNGIVKPDVIEDNPQPHLFAQGMGGMVLLLATALLWVDIGLVGWFLVWVVVGLAALNLFAGFCMGCFIYYQLSKRGISGFTAQPMKH